MTEFSVMRNWFLVVILEFRFVLQVDVDGDKLRPALIGTSRGLRVGQSCFAIGNPYGYEHTLTTGVMMH